ncbi:MAG: squalene/phytoene synthase family protein [Candidatus Micrarchaeota archaeon]
MDTDRIIFMQVNDIPRNFDINLISKNPILDIAARFWDDERYHAFKVCYQSMRVLDDLVDNNKTAAMIISKLEQQQLASVVETWLKNSEVADSPLKKSLLDTQLKFHIPKNPWKNLCKSMIYDIHHNGFDSFKVFLEYCEGAAVAPASIFMHLCGVVKENGEYAVPKFDIVEMARPLARFCYLVHIIRDFKKDQNENLNYFADDLLKENNLTRPMLKTIANESITDDFRNLMQIYHNRAEEYRSESRTMLDNLKNQLAPRYVLSLEIIYSLYLQIFERINVQTGAFSEDELQPSPEEIQNRINQTISLFEAASR